MIKRITFFVLLILVLSFSSLHAQKNSTSNATTANKTLSTTTSAKTPSATTSTKTQSTTTSASASASVSASASTPVPADVKLYGGLVRPHARTDTLFQTPSTAVCGGTSHGPTHYITTQNISNIIQWYIHTPSDKSTCTLRFAPVSDPTDKDFKVIRPTDVTNINDDGSFPCGRDKGIESRTIKFTGTNSCDHCVLEWIWSTPQGKLRECADIMIAGGDTVACPLPCLNGGFCSKGACVCAPGYSGSTCAVVAGAAGHGAGILVAILLVIIAIILIILLIFCCCLLRVGKREGRAQGEERAQGEDEQMGRWQPAEQKRDEPKPLRDESTHQRFVQERPPERINDGPSGNPALRLAHEEFKE